MLQGINRIGKSWVGRVVVTILFGFLIVSFAIWGIGDIFRGQVRTAVATVGGTDISADAYRTAYQSEYQSLIRRTRQSITPDQARAMGLDRQVLGRLVTEAVLERRARDMKLAVPDQQVIAAIQADPNFRGLNGQFDRAQFNDLLRSNGLSEAQYVREQRSVAARLQLAEAVSGVLPVPLALREAVHRYQTEKRAIEYITLPATTAADLPEPTEAQLQTFFDERKALYRAPEYRSMNVLALEAAALAKPAAVSDEDARARYDRAPGSQFGTPEKRAVQQIVFGTAEEANAASQAVKQGTPFEAIAKERGIDEATLNLGAVAKSEMFDPATAEAAFALAEGQVSEPVPGRFGPVLVRVTQIQPGAVKPFAEVADELKREIATERARTELQKVHDAIEDQRAGARSLADIAKERGLSLLSVQGVDRGGRDKAGQAAPNLPEPSAPLLQAAFRSDVGADNEALRTPSEGYLWFEVTGVEPARDRSLVEVKERIVQDWRGEDIARRLAERARDIKVRLDAGETFATVAAELGLKVETATDLGRSTNPGEVPRAVVTRAFATPVGKVADLAVDTGRVLLKVTGASVPPFTTTTQNAAALEEQLRNALAEDILAQYIADAEKQVGVTTSNENMRRAIGGES